MSDREELENARGETVEMITACLSRLARARYLLSPAQRIVIAEELRNVADEFDRGDASKLRRRITLGRYELITSAGPNGRPLFRLAG